jgi:hypothetical protein
MLNFEEPNQCRCAFNRFRGCIFVASVLTAACGGTPTEPDRYGTPQVYIVCPVDSAASCRAQVTCDLYPCAPGTPSDVTQVAQWNIDDPSVARVDGPGLITSVGVGNTVLRVAWKATPLNFTTTFFIPIAVFTGTPPLETYEYEGMIYDGGGPPRTPLNGALVEILTGLVAGRQTTSGTQPYFYPGASLPPPVAGHFAFFGVPAGMYRLRVSKPGFVTQEVDTQQFLTIVLVPQP